MIEQVDILNTSACSWWSFVNDSTWLMIIWAYSSHWEFPGWLVAMKSLESTWLSGMISYYGKRFQPIRDSGITQNISW